MLITIVIPTYNRAALLLQALESVRDQPWRPLEVIVVDDGSTDDTAARFTEFSEANAAPGLSWRLLTLTNGGAARARNHGLRAATGEALLYLDSDDVLTPGGLAELGRVLAADSALEIAHGQVQVTDAHQAPTGEPPVGQDRDRGPADLAGYHWHTMGALYRRELLLRSAGWCEDFSGSDDWIFQARVKLVTRTSRYVDTIVGLWRTHGGDRLGAMSFRPQWTLDVTRACLLIWREADAAGQGNPVLRRKLVLRALRHAWELGRFHCRPERAETFRRVLEIAKGDHKLTAAVTLAKNLPVSLDAPLHQWLERKV
jgi:glycosyltransferase involved in cell wall biosynthesis